MKLVVTSPAPKDVFTRVIASAGGAPPIHRVAEIGSPSLEQLQESSGAFLVGVDVNGN